MIKKVAELLVDRINATNDTIINTLKSNGFILIEECKTTTTIKYIIAQEKGE